MFVRFKAWNVGVPAHYIWINKNEISAMHRCLGQKQYTRIFMKGCEKAFEIEEDVETVLKMIGEKGN